MQLFFFLFPYGRAVAKIVCVSPPSLFSFGIMGGGECDTVVQYAACPLNFVVTSSRGVIDGGRGAQFDSDYSGGDGASDFFLFGGESVPLSSTISSWSGFVLCPWILLIDGPSGKHDGVEADGGSGTNSVGHQKVCILYIATHHPLIWRPRSPCPSPTEVTSISH